MCKGHSSLLGLLSLKKVFTCLYIDGTSASMLMPTLCKSSLVELVAYAQCSICIVINVFDKNIYSALLFRHSSCLNCLICVIKSKSVTLRPGRSEEEILLGSVYSITWSLSGSDSNCVIIFSLFFLCKSFFFALILILTFSQQVTSSYHYHHQSITLHLYLYYLLSSYWERCW